MLDVHPPHSPTHTWRDFLIHIATIVIGLLIAIGLEQSVEILHHRYQRQELQRNLQEDSDQNRDYATADLERGQYIMDWAREQALRVERAGPSGSVSIRPLVLSNGTDIYIPNSGIWAAARLNGEVGLLPAWEQNWLTDFDRVETQTFLSETIFLGRLRFCLSELNQSLQDHVALQPDGMLNLSQMNPAQRTKLAEQLQAVAEAARRIEKGVITYAAYNEFIFHNPYGPPGADSTVDLQHYLTIAARISAQHPNTSYAFAKP
jgi:hypothetical protein